MNMFKKFGLPHTLCLRSARRCCLWQRACLWAGTLAVCVWQYLGVAGNLRGRRGRKTRMACILIKPGSSLQHSMRRRSQSPCGYRTPPPPPWALVSRCWQMNSMPSRRKSTRAKIITVTVEYQDKSSTLNEKLQAAILSGNNPVISAVGVSSVPLYASKAVDLRTVFTYEALKAQNQGYAAVFYVWGQVRGEPVLSQCK